VIVVSDGASGELGPELDRTVGFIIEEEGVGATASIDGFTAINFDEFDGFRICAGDGGPEEGCFARHSGHRGIIGLEAVGCPTLEAEG
jgi:hypothetical protein